MAETPRLLLTEETIREMTRRSTSDEQAPSWAQYLLLLQMASTLLNRAPKTIAECDELEIDDRLGDEMASIVAALHRLLPGGLKEAWHYYLPEAMRREALLSRPEKPIQRE